MIKQLGQNDPCPCGSGKEYKQCCQPHEITQSAKTHLPNISIPESLKTALAHHQAGRLPQAEAIYRQILQTEPNHPDALHLLGVIAYHEGKNEVAVELIGKAIRAKPSSMMHCNLGLALHAQGMFDVAVESYKSALSLKPDIAEVHNNMGNALKELGKLDAAVESFRKALSLKPDFAEAHYNLGNALQAQGKLDEAIRSYHNALSLNPNYVAAYYNLGIALTDQGKLDDAIESYRKALAFKPNHAEAHNNLGNIFLKKGLWSEAVKCYRMAFLFKPDYTEAHYNLGMALQAQGKSDEAATCYRKALSIKPDYAEAYSHLGIALHEQGMLDKAVECYRKALSLKPDYAEAYSSFGDAFRDGGRLDEAIKYYQKALSLKPDYAEAYGGLAGIYLDLGKFGDAQVALSKALELKPEHPFPWAMLAALRKMTPDDSDWLKTALRLVARDNPKLSGKETFKLQFAIGKYYDDTKQYDLAFSAYQQANTIKRQIEGAFNFTEFSRYIDTLIATYTADFMNRQHEGASQSQRPILIVGMPRSGTSLTEQIIASHPETFGAGELAFWADCAEANRTAVLSGSYGGALIAKIAAEYEICLQQYSPEATRIVDKMPDNFRRLGLIHTVFPRAKIIHTQRNPVDTCLSIYFQDFRSYHSYGTDLEDLAFYYREYVRLMRHWRSVLPASQFLDVPYEALVDNQAEWSRRIIEFLGLDWNERCLNFHETERKVATASNWQVRQKIYKTSKARWRNYEKHLGPLLPLLDMAI